MKTRIILLLGNVMLSALRSWCWKVVKWKLPAYLEMDFEGGLTQDCHPGARYAESEP